MAEPYILAGEDTLTLFRTFEAQMKRLGDMRFASALSKERPDVIATVGGFFQPSTLARCPLTTALISAAPKTRFPAQRVTKEDSEAPKTPIEQTNN